MLKAYKPILEAVYSRYSGRKSTSTVFMCIEEFKELCFDAGMVNDCFGNRDIDVCFH